MWFFLSLCLAAEVFATDNPLGLTDLMSTEELFGDWGASAAGSGLDLLNSHIDSIDWDHQSPHNTPNDADYLEVGASADMQGTTTPVMNPNEPSAQSSDSDLQMRDDGVARASSVDPNGDEPAFVEESLGNGSDIGPSIEASRVQKSPQGDSYLDFLAELYRDDVVTSNSEKLDDDSKQVDTSDENTMVVDKSEPSSKKRKRSCDEDSVDSKEKRQKTNDATVPAFLLKSSNSAIIDAAAYCIIKDNNVKTTNDHYRFQVTSFDDFVDRIYEVATRKKLTKNSDARRRTINTTFSVEKFVVPTQIVVKEQMREKFKERTAEVRKQIAAYEKRHGFMSSVNANHEPIDNDGNESTLEDSEEIVVVSGEVSLSGSFDGDENDYPENRPTDLSKKQDKEPNSSDDDDSDYDDADAKPTEPSTKDGDIDVWSSDDESSSD